MYVTRPHFAGEGGLHSDYVWRKQVSIFRRTFLRILFANIAFLRRPRSVVGTNHRSTVFIV